MARKYGSEKYADTVIGLEIVNEPISWGANDPAKTTQFAKDAFAAITGNVTNKNLQVVMHDAFEGPAYWTNTAQSLGPRGVFGIDTHMYQTIVASDIALTQEEHIQMACARGAALQDANAQAPVYVGEWTATTNACINPDGSSVAELPTTPKCTADGCVCVTGPMNVWTDVVIQQVRKYVEAQLEAFEKYSSGYFMWSWTDPMVNMGSWSIVNGVNMGWIPKRLDDPSQRMYPGICD